MTNEELTAELEAARDQIKALTKAEGNAVRGARVLHQEQIATLKAEKAELEAAATTKETEHKAEIEEWKAKVKAKNDTLEAVRTEKSATIDELRAEKQAQAGEMSYVFAQLNSALDQAKEDDADPVQVIRAVKQSIREATKSETARKLEALAAEIAAKNAELAKLTPDE